MTLSNSIDLITSIEPNWGTLSPRSFRSCHSKFPSMVTKLSTSCISWPRAVCWWGCDFRLSCGKPNGWIGLVPLTSETVLPVHLRPKPSYRRKPVPKAQQIISCLIESWRARLTPFILRWLESMISCLMCVEIGMLLCFTHSLLSKMSLDMIWLTCEIVYNLHKWM